MVNGLLLTHSLSIQSKSEWYFFQVDIKWLPRNHYHGVYVIIRIWIPTHTIIVMSTTRILIHVLLELHTMIEVLCLSIGIYLFYKSNNNCTFFYLCFNYFLILYCSILSYFETSTEILCSDVNKTSKWVPFLT